MNLPALAHSPHDNVGAVAVSPAYAERPVVFVTVDYHVQRSTDGGHSWKELTNGLDSRYAFTSLGLSGAFDEDGTVFVSAGPGGVYRSTDEGASWRHVGVGLEGAHIESVAVDPAFPATGVVLATAVDGRVYRSADGGEAWSPLTELPSVNVLEFAASGSGLGSASGPGSRSTFATAVAADDSNVLWLSRDSGARWERWGDVPQEHGAVTSLAAAVEAENGLTVFVGTESGSVLRHGGLDAVPETLVDLSDADVDRWGNERQAVTALTISPEHEHDGALLAATWNEGVFRSTDRGTTWQRFDGGLSTHHQANTPEYRSPQFRDIAWPGTLAEDGAAFVAGFDGLFKSRDGGASWVELETLPLGLVKGLAVAPAGGAETAIAISTYGGGAYVSRDSGRSWIIATEGLTTTRLDGIDFSPAFQEDQTLFAAARGALLKTTNAGRLWVPREPGYSWRLGLSRRLAANGLGLVGDWLTSADERGEPPYPTSVGVSPAYGRNATVFFATRRDGIWVTRDGGETMQQVLDVGGARSRSVAVSPAYGDDGTVFTVLRGGQTFRTVDGGANWHEVGRVFSEREALLDTEEEADGALLDVFLEISPAFERDRTLYAITHFGLRRSADAGETWHTVEVVPGEPQRQVTALALSPTYADEPLVLAAAKGGGLWLSRDAGTTFEPVFESFREANHEISYLAFSPRFAADSTVYAASDETLFEADLAAGSWRPLRRPVRYESHRDVLRYSGEWERVWDAGAVRERISREPGASVSLEFVGPGIIWRGTHGPEGGEARVTIDGMDYGRVAQSAAEHSELQATFTARDLDDGAHEITIEVLRPRSGGPSGVVSVDAFDILSGAVAADSGSGTASSGR